MATSYLIRVQLQGIEPFIWRTIQVGDLETFFDLHEILQIAMGWENSHLFEFRFKDRRIGLLPDEDQLWEVDDQVEDSEAVLLSDVGLRAGDQLTYIYDFGDHWEHQLTIERIMDVETDQPLVIQGARNCPPEGCGGIFGYADLLDAWQNPDHSQHQEVQQWFEEFDPEEFDAAEANEIMAEYHEWRQEFLGDDEDEDDTLEEEGDEVDFDFDDDDFEDEEE
ncbi:MAG: plasmid pRiA4b ORF-3 family protein [Lewinellaceae bacterium]|nr:plasmid pRiA4b ORF-3 family protein [Lewinellaceae bacterium]